MASLFEKDIKYLKGVGDKRAELFKKLGVSTVGTLLLFYPRSYEDWSKVYLIQDAPVNVPCCIRAFVTSEVKKSVVRKNCTIYKLKVHDGSSYINITFFNNKYVVDKFKYGAEFLFFGRITNGYNSKEMASPEFMKVDKYVKIRPIYSQTLGLTSKQIELCIKNAFELLPKTIGEPISKGIIDKYSLCSLKEALENIHFPKSYNLLETAKRRLIFEEFLIFQLAIRKFSSVNKTHKGIKMEVTNENEFYKLLPFTPTNAQKRVISECVSEIKSANFPMSRLIQGDVGAGKTVIAAAMCYFCSMNHFQTSFMAPTEILAVQHFNWLTKLFEHTNIRLELLTGSMTSSNKQHVKEKILKGDVDVVVGTHTLLSDNVEFNNLGFVITDEQHRFGVSQRAALVSKGNHPHLMVMSATPIPRTLSLIVYGDLNVSILDELPPNRQKIDTYHVDTSKRKRIFNFIKKFLNEGRQAYIVCPLVEQNDSNMVSAEDYAQKISKNEFSEYRVGLIHGKMKSREKDQIMEQFSNGELDLLVSTTVIEVGLDVPNSVIMVIENAERFGLAQLHQLRGRVGRGKHKSYCILVSDAQNSDAMSRFEVMTQTNDGFKIADQDLKLRGPGDFFGERQHGFSKLKIGNIIEDMDILQQAKDEAINILTQDPELSSESNRMLLAKVKLLCKGFIENGFN